MVRGAEARPLPLGDATVLEPGDRLLAVGNPQGLDFSVAEGIVSHVGRSLMGIGYLQVDVNVNRGNSGGPLLDSQGRVVGVVSMMVGEASGLGLALPANYLYTGSEPLIAPPPSGRDLPRWSRFLQGVRTDEQEEIAELTSADAARPALLVAGVTNLSGASFTPLRAALVVVSDLEPAPSTFYFSVRDGEDVVCEMSGEVPRWRQAGGRRSDRLGGRMARWLERNGIDLAPYVGVVVFPPDACPGEQLMGRLLHLEDGLPSADRVPIGYVSRDEYVQSLGP